MIEYSSRQNSKIKWIIIHYPACAGKNTGWLFNYFDKQSVTASSHYAVDDNSTIALVHTKYCANHCATAKIKTYCGATNRNSIGIDLMDNKLDKTSLKVEDTDWYIPYRTITRSVSLIAFLMKKYSIDIDHVVRHYDVTRKMCPRPFVGDDVNEYYMMSGNDMWKEFKDRIQREYNANYGG